MRVLSVRLENDDYDLFAGLAAKAGKPPEEIAAEALVSWIRARTKQQRESGESLKKRFIKLRLQDKDRDIGAIADELELVRDALLEWDRGIRSDPEEWSKAFVFANKSIDPLRWEMTVRERFYELWGHRPGVP